MSRGRWGRCGTLARRGRRSLRRRCLRSVGGLRKKARERWAQVFGDDADETFAAWSVARYIRHVAAAGKKELALPMYVEQLAEESAGVSGNDCAGRGLSERWPDDQHDGGVEGGGDFDRSAGSGYLCSEQRAVSRGDARSFIRPDNPLMIPESLGFEPFPGASGYARYLFYAVGDGAIGFANFGLDRVHLDEPLSAEMRRRWRAFDCWVRSIGSWLR